MTVKVEVAAASLVTAGSVVAQSRFDLDLLVDIEAGAVLAGLVLARMVKPAARTARARTHEPAGEGALL